jgi:hypothetical protein
MPEVGLRIMRIPIPVPLIREMDAVILKGIGGYATRAEFIVDAIQERILELSAGGTEDAGPPPVTPVERITTTRAAGAERALLAVADPIPPPTSATMPMTALTAPEAGFVIAEDADLSRPEGCPLFGLHNRDYPSLWALTKLAAMTLDRPVPIEDYFTEVLKEAWRFGELLLAIEKHSGTKCTALIPTNPEKRKPAEMGFRSFAVGDYRTDGKVYATSGPLFEWRLVGLTAGERDEPLAGVTAAGWALLAAVAGISVEEPHPANAAKVFFAHLTEQAPVDWKGFTEVIRAIGPDGATRQDVLNHMAEAWTDWTENEVSTNSAGYIARAREWGLVEPKQTKSHYHLTPLGHEYATGAAR